MEPSWRQRVVFWGDSPTHKGGGVDGFVAQFERYYDMKADVVRRGYPFGYTTAWARSHADHVLQALPSELQRTLFILWFGASDMAVLPGAAGPGVPVSAFEENIDAILRGIKAHHPENDIVLVAPIPVDIDRWRQCRAAKQCLDGEDFDFETYEQCCAYTKRVTSIGFRRGIPVLDLLMLGSDWRKLLVDGVHLHRRGHALMFEALRQLVEQHYTHWQPTRMLGDLPSFDPLRGAPPPVFILPASPDIEDAEVTGGGGRDL
jgi:lysophospholipase L1-like esterase